MRTTSLTGRVFSVDDTNWRRRVKLKGAGLLVTSIELILANFAFFIGLPILIGIDIQAGQPTAKDGASIDANSESDVLDETHGLGSVATDDSFAGFVTPHVSKALPEQHPVGLVIQIEIGSETSMHKDLFRGFEASHSLLEE